MYGGYPRISGVGVGAEGSSEAKAFWAFAKKNHPEWNEAKLQELWHINRDMSVAHFWQAHPELDEQTKHMLWDARKSKGGNVLTDIVEGAGSVITAPAKAIAAVTKSVPVLGDITRIVDNASSSPVNLVNSIASGARIDKALLNNFKQNLKTIQDVAPYAATIVSFVPGIGTGVAAAIAAGAALAEGKSIDEALKAAVKNALPGGAIAATAFDAAMKVASGENVGQAAIESARNLVPAGAAQKAFDIAVAVATGENVQNALMKGVLSMAPARLQQLAAMGEKAVGSVPGLPDVLKSVTAGVANTAAVKDGFNLASGLLAQTGINEKTVQALRSRVTPDQLKGFDAVLAAQAKQLPWLNKVLGSKPATPAGPAMRAAPKPATSAPPMKAPPAMKAPVAAAAPKLTTAPPFKLATPVTKSVGPRPAGNAPAAPSTPVQAVQTSPSGPSSAAVQATAVATAYPPYPPAQVGALGACGDPTEHKWGPVITEMDRDMIYAGNSAVNGSRGRPRMVEGPDGTYLFEIKNGVLLGRRSMGKS